MLIGYVGLLAFGHALYFGWAELSCGPCREGLGPAAGTRHSIGTACRLLGVVAGSLAIRRQGIYFAMITLALAQMMYFVALRMTFTDGEDGIQAVPRGNYSASSISPTNMRMYYHRAGDFPGSFLLIYRIIHSPFGEVLRGDPRERDARSRSATNPSATSSFAFVLSATLAGVAGAPRRSYFSSRRSPT